MGTERFGRCRRVGVAAPGAKRSHLIQSVERAVEIVETLSSERAGLGLVELSQRIGLNASTCHHLLQTLAHRGWVEQRPGTRRYRLGIRILQLKHALADGLDLAEDGAPSLRELNAATGEAVHLAVLRGADLVTVAKLESRHPVKVDNGLVGKSNAAHCTATGKAIMAHLPEARVVALVREKGLPAYTQKTITTYEALVDELLRTRERGYAVDDEEFQPGVYCIGAPIRDDRGEVVASVSCSIPTMRVNPGRIESVAAAVQDCAVAVSARLGYRA